MNANQAGNTPLAKAHAAAVSAALSAAAVYGEWAPLAPLMRSGMLDACAHFLSSPEFRSQACEVLRHVAHRRRGDTVNSAIASGAAGVAGGKGLADHAALAAAGVGADDEAAREAAADAAAVVSGLEGMCRGLGIAAQQVLASPPVDIGSEEAEYARRLTETIATVATNHLAVVSDESLRRAFLEALLGLTKYPRLCVLAAAIPAWPGLLRAMGAELPGTFVRPDKSLGSGVWGVQAQGGGGPASGTDANKSGMLPDGAVVALLECTRTWLQRGGGLASGLHTTGAPECKGDEWEEEYETRDELREAWIGLRARLMEVAKLCTALEPVAAAIRDGRVGHRGARVGPAGRAPRPLQGRDGTRREERHRRRHRIGAGGMRQLRGTGDARGAVDVQSRDCERGGARAGRDADADAGGGVHIPRRGVADVAAAGEHGEDGARAAGCRRRVAAQALRDPRGFAHG